jgi:hypothetical protein
MKTDYNSKQKKIYEEYSLYSTEMLTQMISEKKNYKSEVIRIIKDILVERKGGFYTPKADKLVDQFQIPEEEYNATPQPEDEEGVVYEEVPWLNRNPVYFPGISGNQGKDVTVVEAEPGGFEENEEDEEKVLIKEEQVNYWKCPKCGELVAMVYDVCWNCQSEMPADIIHPEVEEIKKEIAENTVPSKILSRGLSLIVFAVIIFIFDRYNGHYHEDAFRYFISALFGVVGLILIAVHFVRKNR